jgi:hypothetical protein
MLRASAAGGGDVGASAGSAVDGCELCMTVQCDVHKTSERRLKRVATLQCSDAHANPNQRSTAVLERWSNVPHALLLAPLRLCSS